MYFYQFEVIDIRNQIRIDARNNDKVHMHIHKDFGISKIIPTMINL